MVVGVVNAFSDEGGSRNTGGRNNRSDESQTGAPVLGNLGVTWNGTLADNNSGQLDQSKSGGHYYRLIDGDDSSGTSQPVAANPLGAFQGNTIADVGNIVVQKKMELVDGEKSPPVTLAPAPIAAPPVTVAMTNQVYAAAGGGPNLPHLRLNNYPK